MPKIQQNIHLILASNSPIRKKMLEKIGLEFDVISPAFDEESAKSEIQHLPIDEQALFLARNKALSISVINPDSFVIGSDQICQLEDEIISKSPDQEHAIKQLQKLSGKTHYQNNATCIYQGEKEILAHYEKVELKMRDLSDEEIKSYVAIDNPIGSAGSYQFENFGKHLFSQIKGDHDCVLGLALQPILNILYKNNLLKLV